MSNIGHPERVTQNRVITLFKTQLSYDYLGNWQDRPQKTGQPNSNLEETLLTAHLSQRGYRPAQISSALQKLRTEANNPNRSLYENNQAVYSQLRYSISVKTSASENYETVQLIDWHHPENNHFAIAEEVTLIGQQTKRPDLILYLNGIAIGVIELKNSRVDISEGIRQSLNNQKPEFIGNFFSTIQIIFAGNDSAGLRYGTIGTAEKYFLTWKEDELENSTYKLDKYLLKLCNKTRLLDLLHHFILFDGGIKKLPRCHQYFGIKAAQRHIHEHKGGIIWHTQGSGKSITMVLLAKWTLETNPNARIVIVTDRTELDQQISDVFTAAGETIHRATSGNDLLQQLNKATPRLLCTLVHKFGLNTGLNAGSGNGSGSGPDQRSFEQLLNDLKSQPSQTVGDIFVFVDECHRTQSGKFNLQMKALMPSATFIGFTGTPLLKKDAKTSREIFGGYIHTYKFNEAVQDNIVLDLHYEARDIDQRIESQEDIDEWFDITSRGLNDWQKAALRDKWGTMKNVLSSRSRMKRVVMDIVRDFRRFTRLSEGRGNAILVANSIYEACKYYELFQSTPMKGKCAIVTSYNPQTKDIVTEETGANSETDKQFIYNLYSNLLQDIAPDPKKTKAETYEHKAKDRFKTQPANMKLLVVVDKLLTGFDAPSCTFLYIDKSMQDHGLFQAICRVNRLDGETKTSGYIIDYKDLFKKVENAISVYTSELDLGDNSGSDPQILMQDRLTKARDRLDNALEALHYLCEPVLSSQGKSQPDDFDYIRYFCGNSEIPSDLKEREPRRLELYKLTASFLRAYVNLKDELAAAGYGPGDIKRLEQASKDYKDLRQLIRQASGETIDLKAFEADMRHLLDEYIEAGKPRTISPFADMPLLEVITKAGIAKALENLSDGIKNDPRAVAETIENNVRSRIIEKNPSDSAYYDKMSKLLDELIEARKQKAIEYEDYLKRIAQIIQQVEAGQDQDSPTQLTSPGSRALYNNLRQPKPSATASSSGTAAEASNSYSTETERQAAIDLALKIDSTIKHIRPDDWRGNKTKENQIKAALYGILQDPDEVERLFLIINAQPEY